MVDRGITFGDLAGTLEAFTTAYFGGSIHSRLRPSYFPFTEPSAEYDINCLVCEGAGCRTCGQTGWLELGGCGMVHPNVFARRRLRPRGVVRVRLRLRHRPAGPDAPRHRRHPRPVHQRHPLPGAVLMKVLLSWLREFAPIDGDPVALGDAAERPRHGRRVDRRTSAPASTASWWPRCSTCARIPTPTASSWSTSTPATARRSRSAAAPSTWPSATWCPWPPSAPMMPDGMEIERRKLRGEWSNGMLCSGRELGLGDDHAGILVLDADDPRRAPTCATALGIEADVLYDLEINPNRPDAMSVAGVARDLAARLGVPVPPARARPCPASARAAPSRPASVEIVDAATCAAASHPGARGGAHRAVAGLDRRPSGWRWACARSTAWSTSRTT